MAQLSLRRESWPIRGSFTISRGSKTAAEVVVAEISDGGLRGLGECVPYARYGETVEAVLADLEALTEPVVAGLSRQDLQAALPAGAARNALDCALWDLEAKRAGCRAWELAGLPALEPVVTAYTLSLDSPEAMGRAARGVAERPLLKIKLGAEGVLERVAAVREGAPAARLVVDANEAWSPDLYDKLISDLAALGVAMIEQPLPAGDDAALAGRPRPVKLCADESCHDRTSLPALAGRYDMVNIKLDKTGGLTEALALKAAAEASGLEIMVGCMLATSLAMAPALLIAQGAAVVDLDGPLLLDGDRENGIAFDGSLMQPPEAALWG